MSKKSKIKKRKRHTLGRWAADELELVRLKSEEICNVLFPNQKSNSDGAK